MTKHNQEGQNPLENDETFLSPLLYIKDIKQLGQEDGSNPNLNNLVLKCTILVEKILEKYKSQDYTLKECIDLETDLNLFLKTNGVYLNYYQIKELRRAKNHLKYKTKICFNRLAKLEK